MSMSIEESVYYAELARHVGHNVDVMNKERAREEFFRLRQAAYRRLQMSFRRCQTVTGPSGIAMAQDHRFRIMCHGGQLP